MQRAQLIPLGAGVIAALMHLSVALGVPGAALLTIFAQVPIAAAGLSLGFMPAAVAAAVAAVLVAIGSTASGGLTIFILVTALPVLLIVYFSVQKAPASPEDETGAANWYPIGRTLGALTALALVLYLISFLTIVTSEAELRERIRPIIDAMSAMLQGAGAQPAQIDGTIGRMVLFLPATVAGYFLLLTILNSVLAQKILVAKDKNLRPTPVYSDIELPLWPAAAIILGALLSFFGGNAGFFGLNVMLIATIPFFFIGLAVLHSISAAWPGRLFLLMGAYLFLVLLVWPAAIIALLGLIEHWVRLRERMHARRSNKGNE